MKYCPICDRSYGEEATVCDVDGATLHEAAGGAENLVGKTIRGRYNVLKKIGEGGMAVVYLAEQVNIGRSVALKVLHGQYARDPEFVKRFRQEAKLAASLSHPHVVQIYDFDQAEDGTLFFAMEYLAGRSLRALMQQGQLGLEKGVSLGVQMAEGFGVAHRAGVIHRDIKPENVMVIADDDRIKLMDFGIARLREAGPGTRLTRTGIVMGTPMYMAPEQIQGGEVTEKTDIYSLGIVLYEMFTGVAPFKAPTPAAVLMKQLKEAPVPLRKLRADVPASVQSIVARALEKEPSRRPATMGEIADALRKEQVKLSPRPSAQTLVTTQELEVAKVFPDTTQIAAPTIAETVVTTSRSATGKLSVSRNGKLWLLGSAAVCAALVAVFFLMQDIFETETKTIAKTSEGLTLEPPPAPSMQIVSITIHATRNEIKPMERLMLRAKGKFSDGRESDLENVRWQSDDAVVASVTDAGEIVGRKDGRAKISARFEGIISEPFPVHVRSFAPGPEVKAVQIGNQHSRELSPPQRKTSQAGRIQDHIKLARVHRDRGEYLDALAELERARRIDPGSKELQDETAATRRACTAERSLGRTELEC